MATKNILLAIEDAQAIVDINQALGDEWLTTPVASEADALALLEADSFDALLVDFNLGDPDASELLNQSLEKCPEMTRFLLAYEADLALVAAKVNGSHEILPKPIEPASLKRRIEDALSDPIANEAGLATGFDTASTIPSVYAKVLQALDSPDVTSRQVGEIIASDDALTQEVLTLTRSAYLGLPGNIKEPVDAVEVLGLETVRALVMALRFLAEHSHVRPGYLSLEKIWQHSTRVAQIARDLVLFETKDRALASQALAAGLVHDLGKVVLAMNFADLYGRVHALASKQPVALWDVEREMFGANHGEIGACLLGMWNLPSAIVDAASFHHEPPLGEHDRLTPLAAVHIANVLEQQLRPSDELRVVPVMNTPFLNELGLLQRLPIWRATFANQRPRAAAVKESAVESVAVVVEGGQTSQTANHLPSPVTETWTATLPAVGKSEGTGSASRAGVRKWVYVMAALVLFALGFLSRQGLDYAEPARVHARALAAGKAVEVQPSTPTVEVAPAPTPQPNPVATIHEETPEMYVAGASEPANPEPAPELAPVVPEVITTNAIAASAAPKEIAKPSFRVNGIFYTAANPSAVVNGKTVYVGERVNGATVISIGRGEVTLEINGERTTVSLPGAN